MIQKALLYSSFLKQISVQKTYFQWSHLLCMKKDAYDIIVVICWRDMLAFSTHWNVCEFVILLLESKRRIPKTIKTLGLTHDIDIPVLFPPLWFAGIWDVKMYSLQKAKLLTFILICVKWGNYISSSDVCL